MKRYLLVCLLSIAAVCTQAVIGLSNAQAAVGLKQLRSSVDDSPVTVFYPSSSNATTVERGPYRLQLAEGGQPERGNGRLVVLSHGSGGVAWTYADLARQFVEAGFVVAVPEHAGDNWHDMSKVGPASWKLRPGEVSHAIDAVGRDPQLAPMLALDKVGMYGMSAGGHTALTMAGGRWSPSALRAHCDAHLEEDFQTCVGLATSLNGGMFDGVKKLIAHALLDYRLTDTRWYSHDDPRVQAVVAEVPLAADFDLQSLARPRVPLALVRAGKDRWLTPRFHIDPVIKACTSCALIVDNPGAGHGSLLSPQPPFASMPRLAVDLISDPAGFDRAEVPRSHARIVAFMREKLLP